MVWSDPKVDGEVLTAAGFYNPMLAYLLGLTPMPAGWEYATEPTYLIYYDAVDGEFKAKNGLTGVVDFHGVGGGAIIQAAINALVTYGHIYLYEAPNYQTNVGIDTAGKQVRLTGASKTGVVIEMTAAAGDVLHAKSSIIVENLTLKGSGRNNTNNGIYMDAHEANGCTFSDFSNILITDCENAVEAVGDIWKVFFYNVSSVRVQKFCNAVQGAGVNGLNAIFEDIWVDYTGVAAENADYGFDIWSGNALMVYRTAVLTPNVDGFRMYASKGITVLDGLQVDYAGRHGIYLDGSGAVPPPGWFHVKIVNSCFGVREHDATGGQIPRHAAYFNQLTRLQMDTVRFKGCGGTGGVTIGEALKIEGCYYVTGQNVSCETHTWLGVVPTNFNDVIVVKDSADVILDNVQIWALTMTAGVSGIVADNSLLKLGHLAISNHFAGSKTTAINGGSIIGWLYSATDDYGFNAHYWANTDFRLALANKRALVNDTINNWLFVGYYDVGPVYDFSKIVLCAPSVETPGDLLVGRDLEVTRHINNIGGNIASIGGDITAILGSIGTVVGHVHVVDYINTNYEYRVDGTRVVTNRQGGMTVPADVAVAGSAEDGVCRTKLNALLAEIRTLDAALKAHGLTT
jgi:hypothetical protein